MNAGSDPESLQLPERARLLHIGLAKTGTTSLQNAASAKRASLLEHGVRYPGRSVNHRYQAMGLMRRSVRWSGPGSPRPSLKKWQRLMREVEADTTNRILVSHELISLSDDAQAAKFIESLGPRTHVVVTVRSIAQTLPSYWQQYLKSGLVHPFDDWLKLVLSETPDPSVTPAFQFRLRQGEIVRRWAGLVGADSVTVVVVDKNRRDLLPQSFEALLGLPDGILADAPTGGFNSNRSMSLPEAEALREFNARQPVASTDWAIHGDLIKRGALKSLLNDRTPGAGEARVVPPPWALERAGELSQLALTEIQASGVRVVGDLDALTDPGTPGGDSLVADQVPVEVAADLLAGAFAAAVKRDARARSPKTASRTARAASAPAAPEGTTPAPQAAPRPAPEPVRQRAARPTGAAARAAAEYRSTDMLKALGIKARSRLRRR
jgi:hypothetical protein